jgi:hypothetical protein
MSSDHGKHPNVPDVALLATPVAIGGAQLAVAQEVDIVAVDVKKVGQGYRMSELTGDEVRNDKGEDIGEIDDLSSRATTTICSPCCRSAISSELAAT